MNDLGVLNINEEIQKQQLKMQMEEHPEELQQKQQVQFAPEMTREQEKEALKKGRALADKMKDSFVMQKGVTNLSAPLTSELRSEYRENFKDKSLMKSRESKIKNKKSRLYKKNEAANRIDAMEAGEFEMRDMRAKLRRGIPEEERLKLAVTETKDLSVLASMLTHDDEAMESKFGDLVDRYSGFKEVEGENKEKKRWRCLRRKRKLPYLTGCLRQTPDLWRP